MFRLARKFAIICIPALMVVGILLSMLYQSTTTSAIIDMGERSNISLAWATLRSSQSPVIEFLEQSVDGRETIHDPPVIDEGFTEIVNFLLEETPVVRVKIYDANGVVAYSTRSDQIGDKRNNNPHFRAGLRGDITSQLVFQDSFDSLEKRVEKENLIQTYIPIQSRPTSPIVGVFEIYTNVDPLFERIAVTRLQISVIAFIMLAVLFIVLLWSIIRAERTIVLQRTVIDERTHSLELLAERLSSAQEAERERVARELNEGLAQTLAAIKFQIESGSEKSAQPGKKSLVRLIQQAMAEVRRTATDLRPASLDDAGLTSTIAWYCRQFEVSHPNMVVEADLSVSEDEVPESLRISIFRVLQETLRDLARYTETHKTKVSLAEENNHLELKFTVQVPPPHDSLDEVGLVESSRLHRVLSPMEERAILLGAKFRISQAGESEICVTCTWPLANMSFLKVSAGKRAS